MNRYVSPKSRPQFRQQVQNLRLHRDIQRTRPAVAHDNPRPRHQGTRYRHALALPA